MSNVHKASIKIIDFIRGCKERCQNKSSQFVNQTIYSGKYRDMTNVNIHFQIRAVIEISTGTWEMYIISIWNYKHSFGDVQRNEESKHSQSEIKAWMQRYTVDIKSRYSLFPN